MPDENLLIWLPTPMGDAIMATPALRALRKHFAKDHICCFGSETNREVLLPGPFCDEWIIQPNRYLKCISVLRSRHFTACILLKNSFGSALTARLAKIPRRIGYARDGRSWLLTDKIKPFKDEKGNFLPIPAVDYYLRIAEVLGAEVSDRTTELAFTESDLAALRQTLPAALSPSGPLVILVPGGAFGPSKRWPPKRFAQTADRLIDTYHATVVLSVSPAPDEKCIAEEIQRIAKNPLLNLADHPLNPRLLKALFACADLVVTNDTGPRHIAIALKRRVITLFGPNNPQRTQMNYPDEIQLVGSAPCAPCDKPLCKQKRHTCMESITVEQVYEAAQTQLSKGSV